MWTEDAFLEPSRIFHNADFCSSIKIIGWLLSVVIMFICILETENILTGRYFHFLVNCRCEVFSSLEDLETCQWSYIKCDGTFCVRACEREREREKVHTKTFPMCCFSLKTLLQL